MIMSTSKKALPESEMTETQALQARLKALGRNTGNFQQKVDLLFEMIMNCHKRKEREERNVAIRNKKLEDLDAEYLKMQRAYAQLLEAKNHKEAVAGRLKTTTTMAGNHLKSLVNTVGATKQMALNKNKTTTSTLTTKTLEAQRGYSCKAGSTAGHYPNDNNLAPHLQKSMFQ